MMSDLGRYVVQYILINRYADSEKDLHLSIAYNSAKNNRLISVEK